MLYFPEIFYSVEGRIIGIVVAVCAVERGASEEEQVVSLDRKIHVLKANVRGVGEVHAKNFSCK